MDCSCEAFWKPPQTETIVGVSCIQADDEERKECTCALVLLQPVEDEEEEESGMSEGEEDW